MAQHLNGKRVAFMTANEGVEQIDLGAFRAKLVEDIAEGRHIADPAA